MKRAGGSKCSLCKIKWVDGCGKDGVGGERVGGWEGERVESGGGEGINVLSFSPVGMESVERATDWCVRCWWVLGEIVSVCGSQQRDESRLEISSATCSSLTLGITRAPPLVAWGTAGKPLFQPFVCLMCEFLLFIERFCDPNVTLNILIKA